MVGVLKAGKKKYYTIECDDCKSLLKYSRSDETTTTGHDLHGDMTTNTTIECPECKSKVITMSITNEGIYNWAKPYTDKE